MALSAVRHRPGLRRGADAPRRYRYRYRSGSGGSGQSHRRRRSGPSPGGSPLLSLSRGGAAAAAAAAPPGPPLTPSARAAPPRAPLPPAAAAAAAMESNRDEAERCIGIALAAARANQTDRARRFLEKAQRLYPSPRVRGEHGARGG